MVISQIIGGLGNQMFQYAAGRALAMKRRTPFKLDSSCFKGYELHQGFELQRVFNNSIELASKSEVRDMLGWQSTPVFRRILSRAGFEVLRHGSLIVEPHFQYWSGLEQSPVDCYLAGYWQSEKYFHDVTDTIRNDFKFRSPLTSQNLAIAEQIGKVNAISMHVRRGDYVSNPKTGATHGLCSLDYYREAIRYCAERVERPILFIFSDDISWVKSHLEIDFPCHYVDHNKGEDSYNDMRLMSLCKHHIIANSSFSWWGAWLNPSQSKIVIAPKKWFLNSNVVDDLFPTNWVRL